MTEWTENDIPDQRDQVMIVTGGNSGIGYETALALAKKNAQVILAVRRVNNGQTAVNEIRRVYPSAKLQVMELDLSNLASVRHFAEEFQQHFKTLAVLINNAGVMAIPYRRTVDAFEMQFGTNHLGHFALTGLLLPTLAATEGARVVTVSSDLSRSGVMQFDNLDGAKAYDKWGAYNMSKLANILFAYELQRHFTANRMTTKSVAVHPGVAATNLQAAGPRMEGSRLSEILMVTGTRLLGHTAAKAALPTLYAALSPDVNGCDYIGPTGMMGIRGAPGKLKSKDTSYDPELAARLWQESEKLTGIQYAFSAIPLTSEENRGLV